MSASHPEPAQLAMPFTLDQKLLDAFLLKWCSLEEQEDSIREEKQDLRESYAEILPVRALLAAVKVVRTQRKLARHPKEPMPRQQQQGIEQQVDAYLEERETDIKRLMQELRCDEAQAAATWKEEKELALHAAREAQTSKLRAVPDMTG